MCDRFVPPSYHRDLRKKLMRLEQRETSVQDYYGALQKGIMRCGIVEGLGDSICRFYSGLRRDIQDIVDYKDFNTVDQLFRYAMLEEKEIQGRDQQGKHKVGNTYMPRTTPSSGLPKPTPFREPPPASKRSTPPPAAAAPPSLTPSSARSSDSGKTPLGGQQQDHLDATHLQRLVPPLPWDWPRVEGLSQSAGIHCYRRWIHKDLRY
jgi:hypothetical protein